MLKLNISLLSIALCFILLVSCSSQQSPSAGSSSSSTSASDISQLREMTTDELHQYFQQAYDAKGNALDTPEQVALELAEIKAQAGNALLPEDYEEQYKEWRSEHISDLLTALYEGYDKITTDLGLFDGINSGAAYADRIDFDQDGIQELLLISLTPAIDAGGINGWDGSVMLYTGEAGHAQPCGGETISLPPFYHSDYDPKTISLVQNEGRTYIRRLDAEGRDIFDTYYGVNDGVISVVDEISAGEDFHLSNGNEITFEEYEAIQAKYTDEVVILADTSSMMPVRNRGTLPELSSNALRRIALLTSLDQSNAQYARLADMDGDGIDDLLTVVNGANLPFFRVFVWNESELQVIDLNQEMDYIDGVYREKENGKIYICYSGGAGPFSWYFYERVGEVIKISEEELSWEECEAKRSRFELVEDLMFELPKYETVEAVRQQLMEQ